MKTKLKWKKEWLDDNSGFWYSAKVPIINWEYIVEKNFLDSCEGYIAGVYFSKSDDLTILSDMRYKTENKAIHACEKHLQGIAKKFNKWNKTNE